MIALGVVLAVLGVGLAWFASSARVIRQFERGVVFRLGQVQQPPRSPGLTLIVPIVDRLRKVNVQIVTMPVPAQDGITHDNVTVRVDAVVYFRVHDPVRAIVEVQDYQFAVSQVAQTSLRSIIGKSDLDDLLCNREPLNEGLAFMIDSPAVGWGVSIDRVEIKNAAPVSSPPTESFRHHRSSPRPPGSWRTHRLRCSCGCSRPSSRWPPRRTRRWSFRFRSSCSGSSTKLRRVSPTYRPPPTLRRAPASRRRVVKPCRSLAPAVGRRCPRLRRPNR